MVKAIIFDCFGVLTGDLWKEFLASLPKDQKGKAHDLNMALDSGHLSHKDFYLQIHELTGRLPEEVEHIITAKMQKNKSLLRYIAELNQNYKIAILSNISSNWITHHFLESHEIQLFDSIIISVEIGVTKPDRRAFEIAADKLGVSPSDCILVDDSEANCRAAINVGMQAILYDNFVDFKRNLQKILT
jgi:putative hydrolase of the HAD superfamily